MKFNMDGCIGKKNLHEGVNTRYARLSWTCFIIIVVLAVSLVRQLEFGHIKLKLRCLVVLVLWIKNSGPLSDTDFLE